MTLLSRYESRTRAMIAAAKISGGQGWQVTPPA
jgi:hypothetical protein